MIIAILQRLTSKISFKEVKLYINSIVVKRLSNPRRGISNRKKVIIGDLKSTYKNLSSKVVSILQLKLKELGIRLREFKFIEKEENTKGLEEQLQVEVEKKGGIGIDINKESKNFTIGSKLDLTLLVGKINSYTLGTNITSTTKKIEDNNSSNSRVDRKGLENNKDSSKDNIKRSKLKYIYSKKIPKAQKITIYNSKVYSTIVNIRLLIQYIGFQSVCYKYTKIIASYIGLLTK